MEATRRNNVYMEKENNMEKLNRAVIKEEYVAITGDFIKAIILNQFIYWSERINDVDKYIIEENKRLCQKGDNPIELTDGWIYKTCEELTKETMLNLATSTIRVHISKLVELGFLDERQNPKYKWDRTKQYRVNLINIIKALSDKGYHLQDYKYDVSLIENAFSEIENGSLKTENGSYENRKAIPKTTTETTDIKESNLKEKEKHRYGEYGRILLTDNQYENLIKEYGKEKVDIQIQKLDEYIQSNDNKNKYKDFNLVLRKSIRENWFNNNNIRNSKNYKPNNKTSDEDIGGAF